MEKEETDSESESESEDDDFQLFRNGVSVDPN